MIRTILMFLGIFVIIAASYSYMIRRNSGDGNPVHQVLAAATILLALLLGFVGYYFFSLEDTSDYNPYEQFSEK
jgi:TRAP-type C4-dicarboxylate transport system permease small subunit